MRGSVVFLFLLIGSWSNCYSQVNDTLQLTLKQVVEKAKEKSIASKQAATSKSTKYWNGAPTIELPAQLSLSGNLPGIANLREVLQPNGTIEFQPVTYKFGIEFALSQSIAQPRNHFWYHAITTL